MNPAWNCILSLLGVSFVTVSALSFPSVPVNLHEDAVLPCNHTCSGLVTWTVFHEPHHVLAQCNSTSCQTKNGFQISHEKYMKGNLLMTVTAADYDKMAWYTCKCNNKNICDLTLRVNPLNFSVQIKPGDSLNLQLPLSGAAEVLYNSTAKVGPFSEQICIVEGRSLQWKNENSKKTSLICTLQMKEMMPSQSGVYTIRDIKNKDVVYTYTVKIQEDQLSPDKDQEATVPMWAFVLTLLVLVLGLLVLCVYILQLKREIQQLRGRLNCSQPGRPHSLPNASETNGHVPLLSTACETNGHMPVLCEPGEQPHLDAERSSCM